MFYQPFYKLNLFDYCSKLNLSFVTTSFGTFNSFRRVVNSLSKVVRINPSGEEYKKWVSSVKKKEAIETN